MTQLPGDQHITYQFQYRKCGKPSCSTCRNGQGHGPYWYAYWREGSRLRSGYIGKMHPSTVSVAIGRSNVDPPLAVGKVSSEEKIPAVTG
jgi:hypothetical protein